MKSNPYLQPPSNVNMVARLLSLLHCALIWSYLFTISCIPYSLLAVLTKYPPHGILLSFCSYQPAHVGWSFSTLATAHHPPINILGSLFFLLSQYFPTGNISPTTHTHTHTHTHTQNDTRTCIPPICYDKARISQLTQHFI
ncbi:hypothetical protein I7I48_06383 [Histoplasma ohiense]|nr:hypothetical protein I7I48_06383 [Histoplasma ohiense (nom. inval.)]